MFNLILLTQSLIAFLCVSTENFYVPSSSDSQQCNHSNCITLSQFASNYSYHHPNTTLSLKAGNHSLSERLDIGRVIKVLVIRADTADSPNNVHVSTNILCVQSRIYFSSSTLMVQIQGITFTSCTVVFESASASIESSYFRNCIHCGFLQYLGFVSELARVGTVEIRRSNISISGSLFYGNQAEIGGALFAIQSIVRICNSSFIGNTVSCNNAILCLGGAVYACNSKVMVNFSIFMNNSASHAGSHGGVIALHDSSLDLFWSKLSYNVAKWGSGGVIYSRETNIVLTGNRFSRNSALQHGGVMRLLRGSLNETSSHFVGNVAGNEGGVAFMEESMAELCGSNIHLNVARSRAGGVNAKYGELRIINCELSGNYALLNDGGAFHVRNVQLRVRNSSFSSNTANRSGGAIRAFDKASVHVWECMFLMNKAESVGGAIHALDGVSVTIRECTFFMNRAERGGAIHAGIASSVNINMCQFSDNSADIGGVIFLDSSTVGNVTDSAFSNNTATQGGVIGLEISDINVTLCTFEKNNAYEGGVVYATQGALLKMCDVTIFSNSARVGLMYFADSSGFISGNATIAENIGSLFVYNSM